MATALYQDHKQTSRPQNANLGLWWFKYFNLWKPQFFDDTQRENQSLQDAKKSKREWLQQFTKAGQGSELREHQDRRERLIQAHQGHTITAITTSRLIVGLGYEHAIENGFTWHHTLGVPYLPGSSVKGMVRDYAVNWAEPQPTPEEIERIFGSFEWITKPNGEAETKRTFGSTARKVGEFQAGNVIFLDAIPSKTVTLEAEVQTVHYGPWYKREKNSNEVPADWHSPNPIPFLSVAIGAEFQFAILPHSQTAQNQTDCQTVLTWLKEALEHLGIGAKTAVGYGRFRSS